MSLTITSDARLDIQKIVEDATKRAFATALANAKDKVGFLRCPIHRMGATIALQESGTTKASFMISGCCDDFTKCVYAIIGPK